MRRGVRAPLAHWPRGSNAVVCTLSGTFRSACRSTYRRPSLCSVPEASYGADPDRATATQDENRVPDTNGSHQRGDLARAGSV